MFWGLIMEPNKRYTQTVEKPFHVSLAALDTSTGDNEICQVMIVADKKNFLICTLQKGKIVQCPLNHYFKSGEVISFLTNGKCNVHLTGYLDPDAETDSEFGSEDEEAPKLVAVESKREKKRKLDTSGGEVAAVSKKLKGSSQKFNLKAFQKKEASKLLNGQSDSDSDAESAAELVKLLGEDVDSDENDESFNPSTLSDTADSEDEEEYDSDELRRREEEGDSSEEEEEEAEEEEESEKEEVVEPKKLTKAEKRKLKKQQKKQAPQSEKAPQQQQAQQNGVEKKKAKKEQQQQQQQQKGKEQNGQQETKPSPVQREKKTLSGGVFIEDLKVGTGPIAKAGKVVQVYYEGKLKQNNKKFDDCVKGPGFKFRLGSKEVISGWDVGVAGMKVGGKRKIVCPPAMAYGTSGSPPVIPPNATLVFEVELKNVK